ncbi:hypothetical protein N9L28_03715 [Luminiphilus sp.]|nr:hypothetical protein [Luminiphilus sp.]
MTEHLEERMKKEVSIDTEPAEKAGGSRGHDLSEWSKAPKKCPKTGQFLPGTGGSLKGGRPAGSRDKVTRLMVDLARDVVAEHGQEMFDHLARTDPAACLALVTRLLPASDVSKALDDGSGGDQPVNVTINLRGMDDKKRLERDKVERIQQPLE